MEKTLQMVFKNQLGKNTSLSIGDIKDTVTVEEIRTLMQLIITKNIFNTTGGNLVSVVSADIVTRDEQNL
jgi:hypothetical protein